MLVGMTVSGVLTITADGTQIGMGGSGGGKPSLNVAPALAAGQQVTATAELCSVKKSSLPVTVLPAPKVVPPPTVVKPLHACGLSVQVGDCIPGAEIRVFATSSGNTVVLGIAKAFSATTTVSVTPPLKIGWSVHATQKAGGTPSGPSPAVDVIAPPPVVAPTLDRRIVACSRCVRVELAIVGARVDVYQNDVWVGGRFADDPSVDVPVYPGLTAHATVTAIQTVCGKPSSPAKATVGLAPPLPPAPQLMPAFANKSYVNATNLMAGATVFV